MARESQGLQIALIVLVILVIGLSVMSFVLFRQSSDRLAQAKANEEQANKAQTELGTMRNDFSETEAIRRP